MRTTLIGSPGAIAGLVFVVGAHIFPFAQTFPTPIFRQLSASLVLVSVIGGVPTLASDSATAAGWTGVANGVHVRAP